MKAAEMRLNIAEIRETFRRGCPECRVPALAADLGPALAGVAMYVLMAAVLTLKPAGLFPARG